MYEKVGEEISDQVELFFTYYLEIRQSLQACRRKTLWYLTDLSATDFNLMKTIESFILAHSMYTPHCHCRKNTTQ